MLLRDRLRAAIAAMGEHPDYPRLAADVLGIRNAPAGLARQLVSQALVVEDRQDAWARIGERVCAAAPATPGVYILRDASGGAIYVGKANNIKRRLRTHFAARRWRHLKAEFARAVGAEWLEVGSELEALLREAQWIASERPPANVQVGEPDLESRAIPAALRRDVIVVVPSIEEDSVELVAARVGGAVMIQRTRRNGADLAVHAHRLSRFFATRVLRTRQPPTSADDRLAPIVFSWLAGPGAAATRLDPHDAAAPRHLQRQLAALLAARDLFTERIVVLHSEVRAAPKRP